MVFRSAVSPIPCAELEGRGPPLVKHVLGDVGDVCEVMGAHTLFGFNEEYLDLVHPFDSSE